MPASKGRKYKLYLSATEPATSAITVGDYDQVGLITNLSLGSQRNLIDASSFDDANGSSSIAGRITEDISGTARFDITGDDGQDVIASALRSETGTVYFLITTGVVGDWEGYGEGKVSSRTLTFPDEDVMQVEFAIRVEDTVTEGVRA